jgi:exodeoxyribonuclease VII large subunit
MEPTETPITPFGLESAPALTVSQVTRHIKALLETDDILQDIAVRGEISNFKRHSSGHMYFTLKDEASQIPAVMFAGANRLLRFAPEEGMRVVARGRVTIYEPRGQYQLYVEFMEYDGLGALYEAFERLKAKLAAEGLFAEEAKRPIPSFPRAVGLVTSEEGAAIRDMLNILGRRFSMAEVRLFPTLVQGPDAPAEIVRAIALANRDGKSEVLIVGRGGGSIEDLWAFNSEVVARAIRASAIPVVSAVGHEVDFTIADFAADLRAPTPSAAAELVVPEARELLDRIRTLSVSLRSKLLAMSIFQREALKSVGTERLSRLLWQMLAERSQLADELRSRLELRFSHLLALRRSQWEAERQRLEAMSPLAVLSRGYCLFERLPDGTFVASVSKISQGDSGRVHFSDGSADCSVTAVKARE